jgi:hypothetical protein
MLGFAGARPIHIVLGWAGRKRDPGKNFEGYHGVHTLFAEMD